jgi:hypothetical protein
MELGIAGNFLRPELEDSSEIKSTAIPINFILKGEIR